MNASRWRVVGFAALAVAAVVGAVLLASGTGEDGIRASIRATARTSLALFLPVYLASSLHSLVSSAPTRWLVRNRRYLGVSFAVSMGFHAAAILALVARHTDSFVARVSPITVVGGGLGYVLIAAMTATSFDTTTAWLGMRAWRILHTTGLHYAWVIFAFTYLGGAFSSPADAGMLAALIAALLIRLAAAYRRRRRIPRR